MSSGHSYNEVISFWQDLREWLKENQIILNMDTLTVDVILGLRPEAFSHTQQYFIFL